MLALACCLVIACLYVGLLYVFGSGPRHADSTIRRRTTAVLLVSCLAVAPAWVVKVHTPGPHPPLLQQFGLSSTRALPAAAAALASVTLLYLGPLAHAAVRPTARKAWLSPLLSSSRWALARQLLVAPLGEEWCFRAALIPPLLMEGWSQGAVLLFLPTLFGAAHCHALWELRAAGWSWGAALQQVLFQLAYTSLFGTYATWLLLVTGSLAAPVAAHLACNLLGFPRLGALAADPAGRPLSVLLWLGIAGFLYSLRLLTQLFTPLV